MSKFFWQISLENALKSGKHKNSQDNEGKVGEKISQNELMSPKSVDGGGDDFGNN